MPYNPGSAYPRKTVYVPPTYGEHAFMRPANPVDFGSSNSGPGRISGTPRGREAFAVGLAQANADVVSGQGEMNRQGIVGQLQNRYAEQMGRAQGNRGTATRPTEVKSPAEQAADQLPTGDFNPDADPFARTTPTHGNPAAQERRAAAGALADDITEQVLTGDMPGDTGRANVSKRRSRKTKNQPGPGQIPLF